MTAYLVGYEVREAGSQGVFRWVAKRLEANSREEAQQKLFDTLHDAGFETRNPIVTLSTYAKQP